MLAPEQALELAKQYGPTILSIVGALLMALFSGLAALVRWAWQSHRKQMEAMAADIKALARDVAAAKDENHDEHSKVWRSIQDLRAQLLVFNQCIEHVKVGLSSAEGSMKSHTFRLDGYIEKIGKIDSKLEAVFRWLDANKRATDMPTQ